MDLLSTSYFHKEQHMGLISEITNLINEHGSSTILRERVMLLVQKLDNAEKENIRLKQELTDAKAKIRDQDQELKAWREKEQFTEFRGALFKREQSGHYGKTAYCVVCRTPMWSIDFFPYECSRCGFQADFSKKDMDNVFNELLQRHD